MTTIPYFITMQKTLAGNGTDQLTFNVPQNWRMKLRNIYFLSSNAFDIIGIQDNGGTQYTNATQNVAINVDYFTFENASGIIAPNNFVSDLVLEGGSAILIGIKDTSGSSNTVRCLITAEVEY